MALSVSVVEGLYRWGSTLHTRLPTLHENGWIMMMTALQLGLSYPHREAGGDDYDNDDDDRDDGDDDDGYLATGATNLQT